MRKWLRSLARRLFKKHWYKVDMAKFARETLAELSNGDYRPESCDHLAVPLRDLLTLDQVNTLYMVAGGHR